MASKDKLTPEQEDIRMLLACRTHVGCKNCTTRMTPYVYGRNAEGNYIFNVKMTLEKIRLAARVICGIENPADVCVVSGRTYGQRAVLKFAKYTGCTALPTKFTPGTFTNQIQKRFLEPRLLIVTDPITDHQPIMESSYVNIPVIAICDTDCPLRYVDVAIPSNNKNRLQIGIIYWMLAREVLRIRGELPYKKKWEVMPDLFFYREPSEHKKAEEEEEELELAEDVHIQEGHLDRVPTIPAEAKAAIEKEAAGGYTYNTWSPSTGETTTTSWAGATEVATTDNQWGVPNWNK